LSAFVVNAALFDLE